MVNKLRLFSYGSGLFVLLLSVWAAVRYRGVGPLAILPAVLVGLVILSLPTALAYGKLWQRRAQRYVRSKRSTSGEIGSTFVSETPDPDPAEALSAIVEAVREGDRYEAVRRESFSEGDGLLVTHAGFHNSFVRVTGGGKLVVTGASKKTRALADHVGEIRHLSMRNQSNNPFLQPIPIRGSSRVFLSIALAGLLVFGASGVLGAAYPSDTYNTAEKAVFVSVDLQQDVDPEMSTTDARLAKASFVVDALGEEAVEIRWERDNSTFVKRNGQQALAMSRDARRHLRAVNADSPTPAQRAEANAIEGELHEGERRVAAALTARVENGTVRDPAGVLVVRDRLLTAANTTV